MGGKTFQSTKIDPNAKGDIQDQIVFAKEFNKKKRVQVTAQIVKEQSHHATCAYEQHESRNETSMVIDTKRKPEIAGMLWQRQESTAMKAGEEKRKQVEIAAVQQAGEEMKA